MLECYLSLPLSSLTRSIRPFGVYNVDEPPESFPNCLAMIPALWDEETRKGWIEVSDPDRVEYHFGLSRR